MEFIESNNDIVEKLKGENDSFKERFEQFNIRIQD